MLTLVFFFPFFS